MAFGIDSGRYLMKWVGLAVLLGAVAGLGAILLDVAIRVSSDLALGRLAGVYPPFPAGEGDSSISEVGRPWVLPLLVGSGVFVSGLLVRWFAPETAGGGQDAVIEAYHYDAGQIRGRVSPVKLIASAIAIGTGGSAGREGPAAQVSAAVGSTLARLFRLSVTERRICLIIGVAAGIGAIFRAPLGGAVLACEILYRQDFESEAIIPALIASIVSFSAYSTYGGWSPMFAVPSDLVFNQPVQLVYFAVLGLLAGLLGIIYARSYYGMERLFRQMRVSPILKPAIGGVLVGLIAMVAPQILESGYGWVQIAMDERIFEIPLWILLLLPLLKILATGLTVGSGASGGIFGPGIFIGAMLGAGFWRVFQDVLPGMPDGPASFTMIAMIAHFGSIAHVPLAVMIMVAEMTGNLSMLAPAMVAVGIATFVVGNESMFRSQPVALSDSPVHRYQYAFPLLASLSAAEALTSPRVTLSMDAPLDEAEAEMHAAGVTGAPVIGRGERLAGVLLGSAIARIPEERRNQHSVRDVLAVDESRIDTSTSLDQALDAISSSGRSWAPVVNSSDHRLEGIIAVDDILQAYRDGLERNARRTTSLATGSVLVELNVTEDSPLLGQAVRDLTLPEDVLIVSRTRNGVVTFPNGDTQFRPGDVVTVVTSRMSEPYVLDFFSDVR